MKSGRLGKFIVLRQMVLADSIQQDVILGNLDLVSEVLTDTLKTSWLYEIQNVLLIELDSSLQVSR